VAWVPAGGRDDFSGLLAWLGVDAVREHHDGSLPSIAILDLPDLDSVAREHRARVEELLPRVDAVVWVTDPEKYRDAVLHDDFLHQWLPRLDRQLVVLNKADRLGADAETVRRDLLRSLAGHLPPGSAVSLEVVAASAGSGEIEPVRGWLGGVVDAKRVVVGRLAASIRAALDDLTARAALDTTRDPTPMLETRERERAIDTATTEVLRLVDLPGAERQAVAATRAAARPAGAGPLGRITAFFYPGLHLTRWSERGSLAPAVDVLRSAVDIPVRTAPRDLRAGLASTGDPTRLGARLRGAVDATIAARLPMEPPTSRVWPALGVLQTIATVAIAIAAAWIVLLFLVRPPVDTVELPAFGDVPIPFAMLLGGILGGFIIARILGAHAGWLGRRWARSLKADVRTAVSAALRDEAFSAVDRVDVARRALWEAARGAREACGPEAVGAGPSG
jgi:hypothetical protein